VEAIEFELDQAGYAVVDEADADGTITVRRGPRGWGLVVDDPSRGVQFEAEGHLGQSAPVVGLHAVELVHASWLDAARRKAAPEQTPAPTLAPPEDVPPKRVSPWRFDLGVTISTLGLVGPRLGASRHWPRAELTLALEGGFDQPSETSHGQGGTRWHRDARPKATARALVGAAYVGRPGRRIRPLLGGTLEAPAPIVGSEYFDSDPPVHLETIEFGVFFAPGAETGAHWILGPHVALRTTVRAGPLVTIVPVDLAGGGTYPTPRWFATGTMSLLFGRK